MDKYLSKYVADIKCATTEKQVHHILDEVYAGGYCHAVNIEIDDAIAKAEV